MLLPNREERERLKEWLDLAKELGDGLPHAFQGVWEPSVGVLEAIATPP
jgi:hypothetical protein